MGERRQAAEVAYRRAAAGGVAEDGGEGTPGGHDRRGGSELEIRWRRRQWVTG